MKPQSLLDEEWDYLVILDACRNDFFARTYDDYLTGALETRESPGSATPEWAMRTFSDQHDITYFSANPLINSLSIPFNEIPWGKALGGDYAWAAADHIEEVVDIWKFAWDDDLGTVHPADVNRAVFDRPELLRKRDRTIIHYLQPHMPYIDTGKGRKIGELRNAVSSATGDETGLLTSLGDHMTPKVRRWFESSTLLNRLGVLLDFDVETIVSVLTGGETRSLVEDHYERTLRIAMEEVRDLVAELDGDVVVTADHGEAFGEGGVWEHHVETYLPCLVNVPWVRVTG
ncbi:MAG: hypothetical protein ABEH56_00530 [Salinirussus sp.]